ncbi:MAG: CocE/NonD family hydrolase [Betaproteobacteria bacterium]
MLVSLLIALDPRRIARGLVLALLAVAAAAGAAEPLAASLREEVIFASKPGPFAVQLETTLFRPPGDGPFPLVIINHGKAPGAAHFQPRQRYLLAARELVSRGYAVATPMRQGFARSGGNFVAGGCNIEGNGVAQADDVAATLAALARRPDIDASRTVVMGQSHGGLATMALGARNLPQVVGLVNFAGGLRVESCLRWELDLATAMGDYGAATRVPSLWFYGDNDEYFSVETWHRMFKAYIDAGGPARLVAFGNFRANSHAMFGSSAGLKIWLPEVRAFFRQLGLPFDVQYRIVLADHESAPPAPSGFAAIDDVAHIPFINAKGRAAWSTYLDQPPPKAFAVSRHGGWAWRGGDPAAMRQSLERCTQATGRDDCQLYAVDDDVVWQDDPAR